MRGSGRRSPTVPEANRKLLTYHDSWAYWAREYGFEVIGAVQASDFSDPSAREVAELIDQIRAQHVPAVFGSEVFPSTVLEQIASEAGRHLRGQASGRRAAGRLRCARAHLHGHAAQRHAGDDGRPRGQGTAIFADYPVADTWQP